MRKGETRNPGGLPSLYAETIKLARASSPEAVRRLIELMSSEDERVSVLAANSVLDRAWGKAREPQPGEEGDKPNLGLDLSRVSRAELRLLIKLLTSGAVQPQEPEPDGAPTVEGEAVEDRKE